MSDTYDVIEISARPAKEIAARLVVLSALCRRAFLERHDPYDDFDEDSADDSLDDDIDIEDAESERFDLVAWLTEERMIAAATDAEVLVLRAPIGNLGELGAERASWAGESLAALLWSAGLLELAPSYDGPADLEEALALVPGPGDSTQEFARTLRVREEAQLADERERAELWFWRFAVEGMRRDASASDLQDIEDAIAETTEEAFGLAMDPAIAPTDFLVDGRPVRGISEELLDDLTAAAEMRLQAMNWVCGFGDDWDRVPLEV